MSLMKTQSDHKQHAEGVDEGLGNIVDGGNRVDGSLLGRGSSVAAWINNATSFRLAMAPVSPSATKQGKAGANGIPLGHTATVRHG